MNDQLNEKKNYLDFVGSGSLGVLQQKTIDSILTPAKTKVNELTEQFSGLVVTDHNDTDQIEVVKSAMTNVREFRVDFNRNVKGINTILNTFKNDLKASSGEVSTNIDILYSELTMTRDHALTARKDEKEAIEMAKVSAWTAKANRLYDAGFTNNGVQFVAGTVLIDSELLHTADDDSLNTLILEGKREVARIAKIMENAAIVEEKLKEPEPEPVDKGVPFDVGSKSELLPPDINDTCFPFDIQADQQKPIAEIPDSYITSINTGGGGAVVTDEHADSFKLGFTTCQDQIISYLESNPITPNHELLETIRQLKPF